MRLTTESTLEFKEKKKIERYLLDLEGMNQYRDCWSIKKNWNYGHYVSIGGQIEDLSYEDDQDLS